MNKTLKLAGRLGRTSGTILLTGESGTGKDWLARWIHDRSPRARFSYFSLNCAALPSDLAESELFGYERGAFTGAQTRKRGLLELAEGGTLLLNEIGELPLPLQSKLLTFLDTHCLIPLGGEKSRNVDARIIAATHRDLAMEIEAGRFLEPLYYRLNVAPIHIPPLRERLEDIPVLLPQILAELSARIYSTGTAEFDPDSIQWMYHYHWPGNIRELRNVCERAIIMSEGKKVYVSPPSDARLAETPIVQRTPCPDVTVDPNKTLAEAKDELTAAMCRDALRRSGGNKAEAARSLGVSRDAFYRYLRQYKINE
jgi:transcriptional regulator with PAS, ATPase and Fis domain